MATILTAGTELNYEERGNGAPVLWLQGLGADHTAWSAQLARFSTRYRCLAPDNRGSGATAPGDSFDLRTMARDALALLEARTGARVHVVGLSMGASIAQELALHAPERVQTLTLVSASAAIEPRLRELLKAWRVIYPLVDPGTFQRQANLWLFSWRFFERQNAVDSVIAYAERRAAPADWFVAQIDAAITHDTRDRLSELDVPALVVSGAEDTMVPPRLGRDLAARIPGARFLEIEECGHSVNLEQQRAFNEALMSFFDEHSA